MSPSSAPSPRAASSPLSGSAATSDRSLTVFVSYAREDGDACARVRKDLGAGDLTVTGDWDLQRGEEYQQQLVSLIQRADVVVALISPDFARSEACRDEIDQAAAYGKRILPMIVRDLPGLMTQGSPRAQHSRSESTHFSRQT